jgi:hypothetical protein
MEKLREMHPEDSHQPWNKMRSRAWAVPYENSYYDSLAPETAAKIFTRGESRPSRYEIREKLSADTDNLEAELQAIGAITENLERATAITKSRTLAPKNTGLRTSSSIQPSSSPTSNTTRKNHDFGVSRKSQSHKFPENHNADRVFQDRVLLSRNESNRLDVRKHDIPVWQSQLQVSVKGHDNGQTRHKKSSCWLNCKDVCMRTCVYVCVCVCVCVVFCNVCMDTKITCRFASDA